jgi:hypothetical protein
VDIHTVLLAIFLVGFVLYAIPADRRRLAQHGKNAETTQEIYHSPEIAKLNEIGRILIFAAVLAYCLAIALGTLHLSVTHR